MESLLPDGQTLNVQSFSELAEHSLTDSPHQIEANHIINEFKNLENSWLYVEQILSETESKFAKFIALHIFIDGIQKKWENLDVEQQNHYKSYFFNLTNEYANQNVDQPITNEANRCLVEILKYEWPGSWPSFIRDYINASKISPLSCINCLKVLAELSDDAIDNTGLSSDRTYELQAALSHDVGIVIAHAEEILQLGNQEASTQALLTLSHFLRWLELSVVLSSGIVPAALGMISNPDLLCPALSCLRAIAEHPDSIASAEFGDLFDQVVDAISQNVVFDGTANIALAETIAAFLTLDGCCLLQGQMLGAPTLSIRWILDLLTSPETKRICVDCIADLTRYFFMQKSSVQPIPELLITMFSVMVDEMEQPPDYPPREYVEGYNQIHESMRAALVYLAKLVKNDCVTLLLEKLQAADNPQTMQSVCWSIAAVSGAFIPPVEENLLNNVLKFLSTVLESPSAGVEIACAYVYICSYYTRYLYGNLGQLSFIVQRALSFCGEQDERLQDVSVTCLNKVAETCFQHLIRPLKIGEPPFVNTLVASSHHLCTTLSQNLIPLFYQSAATLITHADDTQKQALISQLLVPPVAAWESACHNSNDISQILTPIAVFSKVIVISDTAFYPEVEGVIEKSVELLTSLIGVNDMTALSVREGILGLIESFFKVHADAPIVPYLFQVVVQDYLGSPDILKLPIALDCFTTLMSKILETMSPDNQLQNPFDANFVNDVVLATKELVEGESPEIISSFANLIGKLLRFEFVRQCNLFEELLQILIQCIKRPEEQVSIAGLDGLLELLDDCSKTLAYEDGFGRAVHVNFGKYLLQEMISVALDRSHVPLFTSTTKILMNIIASSTDMEQMMVSIAERVREDFKHVDEETAANFGQILTQTAFNPTDFRSSIRNFIVSSRKTSSKARAIYAQVEDEVLGNEGQAEVTDGYDISEF